MKCVIFIFKKYNEYEANMMNVTVSQKGTGPRKIENCIPLFPKIESVIFLPEYIIISCCNFPIIPSTKEYLMPEITSAEKNGHIRHTVTIESDEKIMLCRCYKSEKFPICDISHAKCEGEVGHVIVKVVQAAAVKMVD